MVVKQTWRVVLADGTVRDAVIHEDKGEFWARMRPGGIGSCQPTPWAAITRLATAIALDVAEVLAPGEPTRAELLAENAAQRAAVREYLDAQESLDRAKSAQAIGGTLGDYALATARNVRAAYDRFFAASTSLKAIVGGER